MSRIIKLKLPKDLGKRTMAFLWKIIAMLGYNQASFARAVGRSQQLIYSYLVTADDCLLSTVQDMLLKLGFYLTPAFIGRQDKKQTDPTGDSILAEGPGYCIVGSLPRRQKGHAPSYILDYPSEGGRLSFLATVLVDLDLNERELCELLGLSRGQLQYIFKNNDIKISQINHIAQVQGKRVEWQVSSVVCKAPNRMEQAKDILGKVFENIVHIDETHSRGNSYVYHIRYEGDVHLDKVSPKMTIQLIDESVHTAKVRIRN